MYMHCNHAHVYTCTTTYLKGVKSLDHLAEKKVVNDVSINDDRETNQSNFLPA